MERKNILVVDDELLIRDLLYDFFSEKNWIVSVSDSSSKALEILKTRRFDLALIDLKMPEIDGLELITSIKARYPTLPIVIITAFPSFDSAIEALRLKIDDYITKPFNINKLFKTVCGILQKPQDQPDIIPTEKY
ncbi:MAG: response regulator [candidate division Zixibacteria bacterium]|nr:response regulator [candidate division Zixibacteria bacterium]